MMRFIFALLFLSVAFSVLAAEPECKLVVTHKPAADVEFKPGLDVHGKPMVEADLNPQLNVPVKDISIPVTVDVAKNLGLAVPEGTEANAVIGTIKLAPDGSATFNDQPLNLGPDAALIAVCAEEKTGAKP